MKRSMTTGAMRESLAALLGPDKLLIDEASLAEYGHDECEDLQHPPEVVARPETEEQVCALVRWCAANRVPVTPIGARTGLSGGALSLYGGVGLSMERFNHIIDIDERNLQATVEPGVITQVLQEAVQEKGLFYPPDPASRGSCSIGGNWAENSGGPKALKYGVTKDYILNFRVVLPSGDAIWTGANVLKNSTGYNLTQLFIGSEGTLGVITKGVVRLLPHPTREVLMLAPFTDEYKAAEAVAAIFRAGITPSVLEFMERDAIELCRAFTGDDSIALEAGHRAHLLMEVDGTDEEAVMKEATRAAGLLESYGCSTIYVADTTAQKEALWRLRRAAGEAVKARSVYKELDTVVPRHELPELLRGVKDICKAYGLSSVCYGHAGDGNLHVNILKDDMDAAKWQQVVPEGVEQIFRHTIALGGTLSGEHGIGVVQKDYMPLAFDEAALTLQHKLKQAIDPLNIMNPGKILP